MTMKGRRVADDQFLNCTVVPAVLWPLGFELFTPRGGVDGPSCLFAGCHYNPWVLG
jgi:hypothetical protein